MAVKKKRTKQILPKLGAADVRQLGEVTQALEQLRRCGLSPATYDLSMPYEQEVRTANVYDDLLLMRAPVENR